MSNRKFYVLGAIVLLVAFGRLVIVPRLQNYDYEKAAIQREESDMSAEAVKRRADDAEMKKMMREMREMGPLIKALQDSSASTQVSATTTSGSSTEK